MEFKGTKGKWNQNNHSVFIGDEEQVGVNVICRLHSGPKHYMGKEQKANALLISKAPEMLEMIDKLSYALNGILAAHGREMYLKYSYLVEDADKLIRQATNI